MATRNIGRQLLVAGALAIAMPLAANAQTGAAASGTLSPADVINKVQAAGYTNIHDVEFDDGRWELEATSPAGTDVDLEVDAATGKILHEEKD